MLMRRWLRFALAARILALSALAVAIAPVPGLGQAHGQQASKDKAVESAGSDVKLHDTVVFRVSEAHGGHSAAERAQNASRALLHALEAEDPIARRELHAEVHVIFAADAPVIELYPEDAIASGAASLDVCSARVLARVRDALRAEKQRKDLAETLFSISIVVFFALIALYLLRNVGAYADRARKFVLENPERIPTLHVRTIEVLGRGSLRGALLAALILGRVALQLAIVYFWLLLSLSRFELTRPYTATLTGLFTKPLLALFERLAFALPICLLALCFGALVYVLLRFVELFFVSVRRGESKLGWLPAELVAPASLLSRATIIVLALVFAGPILTGEADGTFARTGAVLLLSLGLAATPLVACLLVGVLQLFSRRIRLGAELEIGGRRGRVERVGFFDVTLADADGHAVRVPHLLSLIAPLHTVADDARTSVAISVAPSTSPSKVRELLLATAATLGTRAEAELSAIDARGAHFRISVFTQGEGAQCTPSDLRIALAEALAGAGIALGERSETSARLERATGRVS